MILVLFKFHVSVLVVSSIGRIRQKNDFIFVFVSAPCSCSCIVFNWTNSTKMILFLFQFQQPQRPSGDVVVGHQRPEPSLREHARTVASRKQRARHRNDVASRYLIYILHLELKLTHLTSR
jgi:hypothetical protein